MKRKKKHHKPYTEESKRLCLSLLQSGRRSVEVLGKKNDFPSRATLYRWQKQQSTPLEERKQPSTPGPKPVLSEVEREVVGGYVLHKRQEGKEVSGEKVKEFIKKAFDEDVQKSYISKLLHSLHFSSHLLREKDSNKKKPKVKALHSFILAIRNEMEERNLESKDIVAVDVVKFRSHSHFLRTYSPVGR